MKIADCAYAVVGGWLWESVVDKVVGNGGGFKIMCYICRVGYGNRKAARRLSVS